MNTVDQKIPEVALIKANTAPVNGLDLYWLLSKRQIEYLLTDIAALPPSAEQPDLQRAQYQEDILPVLSLEKYYGLVEPSASLGYRYIVTKSPAPQGKLARAIVRFAHPVRIRKLSFEAEPAQCTGLRKNEDHILGAYTLPDCQLVIIPDLVAMVGELPSMKVEFHPEIQ